VTPEKNPRAQIGRKAAVILPFFVKMQVGNVVKFITEVLTNLPIHFGIGGLSYSVFF
jgi:hypothetical protein